MELLKHGDRRVIRIISLIHDNNIVPHMEYRLSKWVYIHEKDGFVMLRSALSKRIYRLDQEEWSAVCEQKHSAKAVEELVKQCFLVKTDHDDYALYTQIVTILRSLDSGKAGANTFTILPTTGCNARCVYCYQEGIPVRSMTRETAERTVEYICKTKREGRIQLCWFGGEPLCAAGIISLICTELRKIGIEFSSSIVTNGSLFTPELIHEATSLWALEKAQVSMDGAREDYESRKRYLQPDLYNYDSVMNNVRLLAEAGIKVTIRCNYDNENLQRVYSFFDDCTDRFSNTGNVRVVPMMLLQELQSQKNSICISEKLKNMANYADKMGFPQRKDLSYRLATHQCMADSGGHNIIIDPAGGLHVCDNDVGKEPLGSIFDDNQPVWPTAASAPDKECADCCFLPDCTPNYKKNCPFCPPNCRELARRGMELVLEKVSEEDLQGPETVTSEDEMPCL